MVHPVIIQYLLVLGITISAVATKPSLLRTAQFSVALSIFLYILITPHPDFAPDAGQAIGITGSAFLGAAVNFIFLESNAQDTLKHNKQLKHASQLSYLQRLQWAATLMFNARGANWNNSIRGLRVPKTSSRWGFVSYRLLWAGFYYLLGDIVGAVNRRLIAFQYPPVEPMTSHPFHWQAIYVTFFWVSLCLNLSRVHSTLSAIMVASGISEPEDWPALFGLWWNTTSYRVYWGRTWHQCMRRSIQPPSKYLTDKLLRLPPKSLLSTYTELASCLFLSGIYHATAEWLALHDLSTAGKHLFAFLYVYIIIMFEDFVIFIGKKVGITKVPILVSYLWVWGWMTVTAIQALELVVKSDNYKLAPAVSVVEMLLKER